MHKTTIPEDFETRQLQSCDGTALEGNLLDIEVQGIERTMLWAFLFWSLFVGLMNSGSRFVREKPVFRTNGRRAAVGGAGRGRARPEQRTFAQDRL